MWDYIKGHPWVIGAAVAVFLIVLVISNSGSTSQAATQDQAAGDTSNGDQIAAYMAQLNLQGMVSNRAYDSQDTGTAAALEVARIQSSSTDLANQLAAQVALFATQISGDTQQHSDTLNAQTQQAIIGAGVTNTQTVANALIQQATIQGEVVKSVTAQNAAVQMAGIHANENIATQSWWDKTFG